MRSALTALASVLLFGQMARADSILYGGNGGHPNADGTPLSIHNGWLVEADQAAGAIIPVGHPDNIARISGLAFASYDLLYASTLGGGGFPDVPPPSNSSRLITINPNTGALASNIGLIRVGPSGPGLSISDLAIQPTTGTLYGIESRDAAGGLGPPNGNLYTIDRATGVATLVGTTGLENVSLAFGPDGTLYATSAAVNPDDPFGPLIEVQIATFGSDDGSSPDLHTDVAVLYSPYL